MITKRGPAPDIKWNIFRITNPEHLEKVIKKISFWEVRALMNTLFVPRRNFVYLFYD